MRSNLLWLGVVASFLTMVLSLPTSLVEEVKANNIKDSKVKRAQGKPEENSRISVAYYDNPTAIKRGTEWEDSGKEALAHLTPSLYFPEDGQLQNKFEKDYRYGINRENLNEALENSMLKSGIYGDSGIFNQYKYFEGNAEERRRKRRDIKSLRLNSRYKREIELTPEEVLTLLTLWENERHRNHEEYRPIWSSPFESNVDLDESKENDIDQEDENWMDTPIVYPHVENRINQLYGDYLQTNPGYIYDDKRGQLGQWGGFSDSKKKRFMIAKRRNSATREFRYASGPPQKNDFYTLSKLLANQHEPNLPIYHRLVL